MSDAPRFLTVEDVRVLQIEPESETLMADCLIGAQARLEDAVLLAEAGRYEGALLMLLVAMSATSRKRYPESEEPSPGKAFKKFVDDSRRHLFGLEAALQESGSTQSLGDFLWNALRCALEHEGQLSPEHHPVRPDVVVTLAGNKTEGIGLTTSMFYSLEKAVARSRENTRHAKKDEVRQRYPEQTEEPTVEFRTPRDRNELPRERLERIEFFLRWFKIDQRAIDALESEKAAWEAQISTGNHE